MRSYDDLHSVTVHLWGATITSWKVNNKEQLFLSNSAIYDTRKPGGKAIRGGIPIVFPQFGEGAMLQHGFARVSNWTFNKEKSYVSGSSAGMCEKGQEPCVSIIDDDCLRHFFLMLEAGRHILLRLCRIGLVLLWCDC